MNNNDKLVVDNIRCLAIDMIDAAGSGHPGIALGAAPIIYTIYANHLRYSTVDSNWINRDRFVMSAGHGSALLYAMLFMAGYDITIEDLKNFRKYGSKTPGHPELGVTPGVDITTGPLGQGFASAVGMALGERYISNYLSKITNNNNLIDYNIYVLCGDGDLMEGISYEAASFAGTQKLNNLIVLYDSNNVSLDGNIKITFNENIKDRFTSMGWNYELVNDGEDLSDINKAIDRAKKSNRPSLIEIKTTIGYGSYNEGKNIVHGKPLAKDDITLVKNKFNLPNAPFYVNENAKSFLKDKLFYRLNDYYTSWADNYAKLTTEDNLLVMNAIDLLTKKDFKIDFNQMPLILENKDKEELRESNYKVINLFTRHIPYLIGGGADISSSTKTIIKEEELLPNSNDNPLGRNIYFGVREHAMGAILNGLALSGLRPFGSTFLSFADYLKPSIRMSALMNLPVTYIFTHDSVSIGPDGPTHQPVEQLGMLRAIPNVTVYRPSDIKEVYGSWKNILSSNNPSVLVISKNETEVFAVTNSEAVHNGAYIVVKETNKLDGVIVASGSEVRTALILLENLRKNGLDLRVVSIPSIELFMNASTEYKKSLLPDGVRIIGLEASNDYKLKSLVTNMINIQDFGASGNKNDVLRKCHFDFETILNTIKSLFK